MAVIPIKVLRFTGEKYVSGRYGQIGRVFRILDLLSESPSGLTVTEIHDRIKDHFPIDKRSIYRDIEALDAAGFPAFEEEDPTDSRIKRWKINRTLKVGKSLMLSPRELIALFLARGALTPFRDTPFFHDIEETFNKIETALGHKCLEYLKEMSAGIQFEPGPRWGLGVDSEVVDTVRACCDEGQILSVVYRSQNSGDNRRRRLGPHFLYFARGSIYLIAEDMDSKTVKVFSVPRMSDPQMLDESYEGEPVDPNKFFESAFGVFQGGRAETVKVMFSPQIAEFVRERRWHHSQQVVPQKDGSVQLTLHVSLSNELMNWILGFGNQVRVLEPVSLQKKLVESAESVVQMYNKKQGAA